MPRRHNLTSTTFVNTQFKCPLSGSIQMSAIRLNSNVHFDLSFSLLVDFLPSETTGGLMPCSLRNILCSFDSLWGKYVRDKQVIKC
ncbi:hypothetical protein FKL28_03110 [Klebsiella pneumoniae]|nr:hypothetical protein [Klebsiella pneumoniae]MBK2581747.1 hypothetical protein [Klebsiella pneumoniae]HBW8366649.1 hypothetical protein [Klebsiella pneumoniae]